MDTKRILIGTLAGGVAMYVLGYLIFDVLFGAFYASSVATGVLRDTYLHWAVVLGTLSLATLVTLAIESRPGIATIGTGFTTGAIVGLLVWLGVDFIRYGMTNVPTLARTVVDPILEVVRTGASGAVIAAVLARIGQPEARAYMRT